MFLAYALYGAYRRHFMRKPFTKIVLLIISLLLVFSMTACNDTGETEEESAYIVSISIDASTIPVGAVAGAVELSQIKLIVLMSDDSISYVPVTDSMVFTSDRNKLLHVGTHHISLIYGGMSTRFSITITEAPIIKYTLTVMNGAMKGKQPIDGVWSGKVDAGARVIIEATNRSSEGYVFVAWKVAGQTINIQSSCEITVDDNMTVVADYTPIKFSVNFNADGGTNVPRIETGRIEEPPVSTKDEYVFVKWKESDTNFDVTFPYVVTKNVTLKAVWESLGLVYDKAPNAFSYTVTDYIYTGTRTSLVIPESHNNYPIVKIAKDAFRNATTLRNISFSSYITDIDDYAFSQCVNLQNFAIVQVGSTNSKFSTNDGVLYEQDKLLAYPAGRMRATFDVESELVSTIGNGAFYNANIGCIKINSTLTDIGDNAFNSRTIDNVIFTKNVPQQMGDRETIFNDNIRNIFITQNTYINDFKTHSAFAPYEDKIEELENTTSIKISGSFLYRVITRDIGESTIEIIGIDRSLAEITIPAVQVEGKDVTSIGSYAFSYSYNLENIIITQQSKLERIMKGAFDNTKWQNNPNNNNIKDGLIIINNKLFRCLDNRKEYTIPYTVIKIAEESFSNMTKLEKVIFQINPLGDRFLTSIDIGAFKNCINLDEIEIPKNVNKIGANAFENTKLGKLSFETGSLLEEIEAFSFLNAKNLKSISLGDAIKEIGSGAFNGCYSLEEIKINNNKNGANNAFITKDGVLFQKNKDLEIEGIIDEFGRILHTYPAGRIDAIYTLPYDADSDEGVTHIKEYAFYYSNVGAIVLPTTIESIIHNSFIIPQLVYIEFTSEIKVATYTTLFSIYSPQYIFISEGDSTDYGTFGAPEDMIMKKSKITGANQLVGMTENVAGQKFVYRYDSNVVYIISAERGKETLMMPSFVELGDNTMRDIVGIGSYAFIGGILVEIDIPSTINIIKAYAFYYSSTLKRIISRKEDAPTLEYVDVDNPSPETVLSFNPSTIIENALVFVLANSLTKYVEAWPVTEDFVIMIGEQPQIIFNTNGGSVAELRNPINGELIDLSALNEIERSPFTENLGYEFGGWYENSEFEGEAIIFPYQKYKNANFYAKWNVRSFNITFDAVDGILVSYETTVNFGEFYDLAVPTKTGYTFEGWFDIDQNQYTDSSGTGLGIGAPEHIANNTWGIVKDMLLFALWVPEEFIITYDATGGTVANSEKVVSYNDYLVVLDIPTREGYDFKGWKDSQGIDIAFTNGKIIKPWTYTTDITIYASWTALSYIVKFYETQFAEQTVVYGQHFTFPIPTKEGSVFFGWYDGLGGTGTQYTNNLGESVRVWDKVGTNIYVFAQWPIKIAEVADFDLIRNNPEGSYILTNDIELIDEWVPIGLDSEWPFTGILDGNGYTINNMSITQENEGYLGFIGYNKGIIRNLKLGIKRIETEFADTTTKAIIHLQSEVNYQTLYVGGIVGYNDTVGQIINCEIATEIVITSTTENRSIYAGGIAGYNKGKIKNTYIIVELDATMGGESDSDELYIGSLVGYHQLLAEIQTCRYDRIVSSQLTQTKACGNESIIEDFGLYIDTLGTTTQSGW